jgi:membrane-associated phospholipid phosphatase
MHSVTTPSLRHVLFSLMVCAVLVSICYAWVDPAVAFWVDRADFRRWRFFEYCTHLVDVVVWATALYYGYCALTWRQNPAQPRALLNIANSVTIAVFLKDALKVVFGRYWPATWINHNPSLLHDNAYGFHPFHVGTAFQSFPSGHTTVACAAMAALWLNFPRWRVVAILGALLVIVGLLANDYHFVGDCIAGVWLGTTVAVYVYSSRRTSALPQTKT